MSIQTNCPNCDASYTLAESQRGKKVRCRKCSDTFTVGDAGGPRSASVGAAKSGKLRKDGLQASPRPPARTPPPKTKPAVTRDRDRDRDRDDDEEDRREPAIQKKSGSAMPMILMIGGGLLVLFLICGGGSVVGVYWWTSAAVSNTVDNMTQNLPNNDPNDPFAPNGGNPFGQPGFGQPGFVPADNSQPKDVGEALDWVKNGATAGKKNTGADWLARSAVDDARQKEVAAALKTLIGNPNSHDQAVRALANWASADDVPALIKAYEAGGGGASEAADALVRLQDDRAAPVFARKLRDVFERGNAARRLTQLGPVAEKEVLKYMDDKEAHGEAVKLLEGFGTKPDVMFNQAIADLSNPDSSYRRYACEYLSKTNVNETRHDEVSKALELPMGDSDGETRKAAAVAMKTWGTKANVDSLVRELDSKDSFNGLFQPCVDALVVLKDERGAKAVAQHLTDFFQRAAAAKALREMGPVAAKAVAGYVNNSDPWVKDQATSMIKSFGAKPDLVFDAAIEDLDAADAGQRKGACEFLAKQKMNEAQQGRVARALDKMLDDGDPFNGVRAAAAKAEVVWGDKDSVPALVKGIQRPNSDIWEPCMEALARIKDQKSVIPLLAEAGKDKPHAKQAIAALNQMGPVVEAGMDDALNDPAALPLDKLAICQYLGLAVGTKASLPALQMAAMDPVPQVKAAANAAIAAIKKRNP